MIWVAIIAGGVLVCTFAFLWILQRLDRHDPNARGRIAPVPWIDDALWLQLKERGGSYKARGAVVDPHLVITDADDRARCPIASIPAGAPVPAAGSLTAHRRALWTTPGWRRINGPVWPVCCKRLTTLVAHQMNREALAPYEAEVGPLDQAFVGAELDAWGAPGTDHAAVRRAGWAEVLHAVRQGAHSGQGLNLYQCRACGRLYIGSCGP